MAVLLNESVVAVSDVVYLLEQINLPPELVLWQLIWQMLFSPSLWTKSIRDSYFYLAERVQTFQSSSGLSHSALPQLCLAVTLYSVGTLTPLSPTEHYSVH